MSDPAFALDPAELAAMLGPEGIDPAQPTPVLGAAPNSRADFPTEGSPPFINRRLSLAEWRAYCAGYDFGSILPTRVVLHHTYIPTQAQWRGLSSMRAMQGYYAGKGWTAAPHIYVGPDGIWLATPLSRVGIHAGIGNGSVKQGWYSIGLEMVGDFDAALPSGPVWEGALAVMAALSDRLAIPPRQLISLHRDYTTAKSCPGRAVTREWVYAAVEAALAPAAAPSSRTYRTRHVTPVHEAPDVAAPIAWGGTCVLPAGLLYDLTATADPAWLHWPPGGFLLAEAVELEQTPPATEDYSEFSGLFGAPRLTPDDAAEAVIRRGSLYTPGDVRVIAGYYWRYAAAVGLNPDLVWAQVIHETSERQPNGSWWPLSSWWARRPRRNGAGIGVTGKAQRARPASISRTADGATIGTWAQRGDGQWAEGLSFPSWEHACRAHLGRLLLYAQGMGGTADQQAMARWAHACRPLDTYLWGSVATLRALGAAHNPVNAGVPRARWAGWAVPGDEYGAAIAHIANELVAGVR